MLSNQRKSYYRVVLFSFVELIIDAKWPFSWPNLDHKNTPKRVPRPPWDHKKNFCGHFWWFHWFFFYGKTTKPQNDNNTPAINNIGSTPPFFCGLILGCFGGSFWGSNLVPYKKNLWVPWKWDSSLLCYGSSFDLLLSCSLVAWLVFA